jgi:hypothetical protein
MLLDQAVAGGDSSDSDEESESDSDNESGSSDSGEEESDSDAEGDENEAGGGNSKPDSRSIKVSEMMREQISVAVGRPLRGRPREQEPQKVDVRPVVMDVDVPDVPVLIAEGGIPGLGNKAFSGSQTKRSRSLVTQLHWRGCSSCHYCRF